MQFDHSLTPPRTGLPADIADMRDRLFYKRRAAGLNVQFVRETDGKLDEFSLSTHEEVTKFCASLARKGVPYCVSA